MPTTPTTTTDCLGVVRALAAGRRDAATAKRPQARIWNMVFNCLDDMFIIPDTFAWMPAHCSRLAVISRHKSNVQLVTERDWRANRLADALAKRAARRFKIPDEILQGIKAAETAVDYAAAMIGVTTYASNHFKMDIFERGESRIITIRDCAPLRLKE